MPLQHAMHRYTQAASQSPHAAFILGGCVTAMIGSRLNCDCQRIKNLLDDRVPVWVNNVCKRKMATEENLDHNDAYFLHLLKKDPRLLPFFRFHEANIELKDCPIEDFEIEKHQPSHLHENIFWEANMVLVYYVKNSFRIKKRLKVTLSASDLKYWLQNRHIEE